MIKGVHQLTLRPNTLISLVDHFTILNGWKDGWTDPCADPGFLSVEGGPGPRPAYRIRTWDQYVPTYVHARTHAHTHARTHTHMYRQQTDT